MEETELEYQYKSIEDYQNQLVTLKQQKQPDFTSLISELIEDLKKSRNQIKTENNNDKR